MSAPMTMPAIARHADEDERVDEAELALLHSWPATRVGRWRRTGMTCGRSSSGPPTRGSSSCRRPDPRSSSTSGPWKLVVSQRRPSTGGCPPSAAITAAPTSMVGSRRTRRSTSAAPRSTPTTPEALTAPNSGRSCSPPSGSIVPRRSCRARGAQRPAGQRSVARPTLRTSAWSEATGPCASSARATNRPHPFGAQDGPDHRHGDRGTHGRTDSAPPRRRPAGPPDSAPMGPFDRQTSRARPGSSPHAASRVQSCAPSRRRSRCARCRSLPVTPTRGRRPSTTTRQSFDRHAAYVVVAFVAGG